jgi:hypothetical protein
MPRPIAAFVVLGLALPARLADAQDRSAELMLEIGRLRAQLVAVEGLARGHEEAVATLSRELRKISDDVGVLKAPQPQPIAGPFLSGPPTSSDSAGVAKVAVFAPRVEVDSPRRHDAVFLKLKRIEAETVRTVAEVELGQDATSVDLPLDRSGALFVLEWSTTDGHNYNLFLKDGASGQTAASVVVKQLQSQGRFLFVGYRLD